MSISLSQILDLVGKLDDSPGAETPRERFRRFLKENVVEVGQVRDYIEECLRKTGDQYNRALQDLVNLLGEFLKFHVTYGRYQGIAGQIGFDGHWESPMGFHIVVEVKTTEAYAIKTATILGYVDGLISEKKIPSWDEAMGLYVVGRVDRDIRQLENAIVAEKRTHQLRIISVESLLSLAEMMNQYDVSHEDVLAVMRPSGPAIDSIVDLMDRLVAGAKTEEPTEQGTEEPKAIEPRGEEEAAYWLTPVKSYKEETAEECIRRLVAEERIYAFGERTPGRRRVKPGDWICFYATGKGVVAHARIASLPEKRPHPKVRFAERYPWVFRLDSVKVYLDKPVIIDVGMRNGLKAFQGRNPSSHWAWFVQATRNITAHDFHILTQS